MAFTSRISSKGQITIPKEVRAVLCAVPGDLVAYEVEGNVVTLRRIGPCDAAYHAALSQTLDEWNSAEDEKAFRDL
ncbi:MAG TPA: AbrB/MazE/SpoVT family DNA-binding domain-containing protein [Bryobacteraceae bacterium]|nr:AbrB/MazE/SpoVT family DNA-binding domain-containing protein [Bryobacteraceae bacterium]